MWWTCRAWSIVRCRWTQTSIWERQCFPGGTSVSLRLGGRYRGSTIWSAYYAKVPRHLRGISLVVWREVQNCQFIAVRMSDLVRVNRMRRYVRSKRSDTLINDLRPVWRAQLT